MASNDKVIRIYLKMIDEMSGPLGKASNSLQKIGGQMTSIGTKMTAGITAPLVGMGVAMFKTFADFESVMAELEARTGSTAAEMEKMKQFAIEMGRDTAFSATQAAEALVELTSSGSSAAEAMEQLPAVLDLAAAGALDLKSAADGVTDILAQFQLQAKDSAMVVDALAKAAGSSSATVSDLVQAFGNAGPVAQAFGMSVNETAAALAVLAEAGIKGAEGGTQLKSMLLNMTRDTESVSAAWTKLGVSMFDSAGNMRDIDDVFKDINRAMEGMSTEEQIRLSQDLAGSYGIVGFNALRASNGISGMQDAMTGAAGASEVADARMNTLAGRFSSLMGSIETLAIVLGGLGEGPLVTFIEGLTKVINKITEWAQNNPKLAQMVMVILAIVAALGPLLVIIGSIVGAIGTLAAAFTAGGVFAGIGAAFAGAAAAAAPFIGTILLIVAAVVALIAIFKLLQPYFGTIVEAFKTVGKALLEAYAAFGGLIVKLFQGIAEGIAKIFVGIAEGVKKGVLAAADAAASGWQKATTATEKHAGIMGKNFSMLGTIISELVIKIMLAIGKLATGMVEIGKNIVSGLINGINSMISSLVNKVKEMASKASNAVKGAFGIASPSKLMMKYGTQVVEGFNKGIETMGGIGVTTPQLAPAGASARPTVSSAGGSSGGFGGGGNIHIENLNVPPGTTQEQVRHLMKEFHKEYKRVGGIR